MIRSLYIHGRFYGVLSASILLFILGVMHPLFFYAGIGLVSLCIAAIVIDAWNLFNVSGDYIEATRQVAEHLSNGDLNDVTIKIISRYAFPCRLRIIDELPVQFQARHTSWKLNTTQGRNISFSYQIRPVERGAYTFGALHVYVASPLSILMRRWSFDIGRAVKVYPSYLQLRKFAFLAFDRRLQHAGLKRMRRLGHTSEFEQIKEYVIGDDTRTLNWKATARTGRVMVNQYRDQRAQPVYCIIDKGRLMQMPFEGMTLLDYAINTSLVMSYIAIRKEDNAGLVTFADTVDSFVAAGRRNNQMYKISEALYNQETTFPEADFERLYVNLTRYIPNRSLLLIFTNFESMTGLKRQLPFLRKMADKHVVVAIFFQNTELHKIIDSSVSNLRDIYHQTLAEKMQIEKEGMINLLMQWGIHGILTSPKDLTVNTINRYLELKARGTI